MIRGSLFGAALTLTIVAAGEAGPCAGTIFLTFDTGNMAQAEDIAQVLAAEQVRATFFPANEKTARGDHALDASWAAYWRARVAEGHVFANHTWSHHYRVAKRMRKTGLRNLLIFIKTSLRLYPGSCKS